MWRDDVRKVVLDAAFFTQSVCLPVDSWMIEKKPFGSSDMDWRTKGRKLVVLAG